MNRDGIAIIWLKNLVEWLKDRRWKAIWPYLIVLLISVTAWVLSETGRINVSTIWIKIFEAISIFALIKILFEESSAQDEIMKHLEEQKTLLDGYAKREAYFHQLFPPFQETKISKIFPRRSAVEYKDINSIFEDEGPIKMAGILLSEFVDVNYHLPGNSNNTLRKMLSTALINGKKIELLILDPYSSGADLMSKAAQIEHEDYYIKFQGIANDLQAVAGQHFKAQMDIRLCRSFPTSYLILSSSHALFQPNILHDKFDDLNKSIPTLKYVRIEDSIFSDLEKHFNTVWHYDSISYDELKAHEIGVYHASTKTNIKNIYIPRSINKTFDPIERMKHLIMNTKDILWVKQVSLYQILGTNGQLYGTFIDKCREISDIKLLLIDPESEQAKMRSFREHIIQSPRYGDLYSDFLQKDIWKESILFRHTTKSITNAKRLKRQLDYERDQEKIFPNQSLDVKKFFAAPDSSIIITDTAVLFEPLHYGSQRAVFSSQHQGKILSGDMPMLEFTKETDGGVYDILKDNVKFVFDYFSKDI